MNALIVDILKEGNVKISDLIAELKSVKNKNEIMGFFQAAILDGISLVKLFARLSKARKNYTEKEVSEKLLKIKNELVSEDNEGVRYNGKKGDSLLIDGDESILIN